MKPYFFLFLFLVFSSAIIVVGQHKIENLEIREGINVTFYYSYIYVRSDPNLAVVSYYNNQSYYNTSIIPLVAGNSSLVVETGIEEYKIEISKVEYVDNLKDLPIALISIVVVILAYVKYSEEI